MPADDALREEIARALYESRVVMGEPNTAWDRLQAAFRADWLHLASAIRPIVTRVEQEAYRRGVAEVRAAYDEVKASRDQLRGQVAEAYRRGQADGWDEGARTSLTKGLDIAELVHQGRGWLDLSRVPEAPANPYCTNSSEKGSMA